MENLNTITMENATTKRNTSSRSLLYFRKLWIEKKKTFLLTIGAYLGFWALCGIMVGLGGGQPGAGLVFFYALFTGFVGAFISSQMFYDIVKKNGRISVLMTPVSAKEKFLPRLIIVSVGFLILAFVGYFLCELACIVSLFIFHAEFGWLYNPLQVFNKYEWAYTPESVMMLFLAFSSYLANNSIYMLGSVAWPKLSFLKTVFLLAVLQVLFIICISIGAIIFSRKDDGGFMNMKSTFDGDIVGWVVIGIILIVACGLTVGAYYIFKRKTLKQKL